MAHKPKINIMQYLNHIVLSTGHTRRSYRSEVTDDVISMLRPVVLALRQDQRPNLSIPDYWINGPAMGHACVIWTIWHSDGSPIATIGLANRSRCGAQIWRALHEMETPDKIATHPGDVPAAPWLAVRLHIGASMHLDCMEWLGDFQRCFAWAWIESEDV